MNSLILSKQENGSKVHSWEVLLDLELLHFLKDHCVQGMTVLPGSSYVELALTAAVSNGERPAVLENVQFQNIFILPESSSRKLQMTLSPESNGGSILRYFSDAATERAWPAPKDGRPNIGRSSHRAAGGPSVS